MGPDGAGARSSVTSGVTVRSRDGGPVTDEVTGRSMESSIVIAAGTGKFDRRGAAAAGGSEDLLSLGSSTRDHHLQQREYSMSQDPGVGNDAGGGSSQLLPHRQLRRRGRQSSAGSGTPQPRLRRRRGPSAGRGPGEHRAGVSLASGIDVLVDVNPHDDLILEGTCPSLTSRRSESSEFPNPPALPAERRADGHDGACRRGGGRGAGGAGSAAAAALGQPGAFGAAARASQAGTHNDVIEDERAGHIKRRRIRGKQTPLLAATSAQAASSGPGRLIDLPSSRNAGDDTAWGAVVERYNSVHASAVVPRSGLGEFDGSAGAAFADGDISRGSIAGCSGWSPSRFALHSSTEQRSPGLGHRDGLLPAAGRDTDAITWSASGGRPPDAAAERAA